MPKRKKLPEAPDYKGLGDDITNAEIQKSRPLQSLAATDLTIAEFKILDFYLARINSHDPDKRTVQLERGELERALGVTRILKDDLDKRLCSLFTPVNVIDDDDPDHIKRIGLFEEAEAVQDKDGLWIVTLTCTPSAMKYIFNIENLGYLRYRLKNVVNLTSRYSYILFLYLIDNRFRKTWTIELDKLKELLKCTAARYEQYKYFNAEVLKVCQNELSKKTDIVYDYKPVRRGRFVSAIEFTVQTVGDDFDKKISELRDDGEFVGQVSFDDLTQTPDPLAAAVDNAFNGADLRLIAQTIKDKGIPGEQAADFLRRVWLKYQHAEERKRNSGRKIGDRVSYLISMIRNEGNQIPKIDYNNRNNLFDDNGESSFSIEEWRRQAESYDPETILDILREEDKNN